MIRKLVTEKNDLDTTARITITGYLIEVSVLPRNLGVEAWDVNQVDKNTGAVDNVASTGDFTAAIGIGENHLRRRAIDEKIDGYESLESESD